ncbi:MAG: membrane protein insertase YidC [Gemmatimonadaceae bacterium]|nr:membrane protein insertase YidC [Gemmatimonadaceae bacterium]
MDKRFFLALLLSLIVVAISQVLFPSSAKKAAPAVTQVAAPLADSVGQVGAVGQTVSAHRADSTRDSAHVVAAEARATIATDKAIYTFSNIGAGPVSLVMKDFANRSPSGGKVDLAVPGAKLLAYKLVVGADTLPLEKTAFDESREAAAAGVPSLVYSATVSGTPVRITYSFGKAQYVFHVSATVGGTTGAYLLTSLPTTLRSAESDTTADQQSLAYVFKPVRDHPGSVLFGKMDPGESRLETGPLKWVAVKNKYFVLGIVADHAAFTEAAFTGGARTTKVATHATATAVQPGTKGAFSFDVYAGPQEWKRLVAMGYDFDHVNPYGWKFLQAVVHPVASLVIQLLLWMHNVLRLSYGWVLVILGLAVRLVLWPLNQSTMRSSLRMQSVQPKLAAVQKKYKDDPRKQQEAIMKVYQEEGISPLAPLLGCLPALLPMPIFFALFFVFQNTIEFRGVPFLWLHDLSAKDPLYIIPLLMGVSMYVLSWIGMRNAPPNPQTKMMSYMFPVMMTVFLLNMASGLNLYYTAQNLAALPQQWLIARERLRAQPSS